MIVELELTYKDDRLAVISGQIDSGVMSEVWPP